MGYKKVISQFILLMWKKATIQKRKSKETFLYLALPFVFTMILALIRISVGLKDYNETLYPPYRTDEIYLKTDATQRAMMGIMFAPNSAEVRHIMWNVQSALKLTCYGFVDEAQVIRNYEKTNLKFVSFVAVIFEKTAEEEFVFKIRPRLSSLPTTNNTISEVLASWYIGSVFPLSLTSGPNNPESRYGSSPTYMESHLLLLQETLSRAIIHEKVYLRNQTSTGPKRIPLEVNFTMERFPFPKFTVDKFMENSQLYISIFVVFSFLWPSVQAIRNMVGERESKMEEAMKIMGLISWINWATTFLMELLLFGITSLIITSVLKVEFVKNMSILTYSSFWILLFILMVYSLCSISLVFLISVFFTNASMAAAAASVVFILGLTPFIWIMGDYKAWTFPWIIAICIFPNTGLGMIFKQVSSWEGLNVGVKWEVLSQIPVSSENYTIASLLNVLVIESVIFFIVALYLNEVVPKMYGYTKPWYFPVLFLYRCIKPGRHYSEYSTDDAPKGEMYQENSEKGFAGIQCLGLSKKFKDKLSVNKLFLNAYDSQITVVLGHNGAGKSTSMALISGMITPTSGTAIINGYNLQTQMHKIRKSLGFCPQYNVLFENLTVHDHLYFFSRLKGNRSNIEFEINSMLERLDLEKKRYHYPHMLSGGMKRKLSVGNALVGGTKIILLDEPSSGMDPSARRFIWDLLLEEKKGRTILLTTQFMEEADALGDKIGIMEEGKLQCEGTPLFLKNHYGVGYHMIIVKEPNCNVNELYRVIQTFVPNASLESNIGAELSFTLPRENSKKFESMFNHLESKKADLGISSYGASLTTMEEVFLKVGEHATAKMKSYQGATAVIPTDKTSIIGQGSLIPKYTRKKGAMLYWMHFTALSKKKFLFCFRSPKLTFSQLILPCIVVCITLAMLVDRTGSADSQASSLDVEMFKDHHAVYYAEDKSDLTNELYNRFFPKLLSDKTILRPVDNETYRNVEEYLLSVAKTDEWLYNTKFLIAFSMNSKNASMLQVKSLFNTLAMHSLPTSLGISINLVYNYYLTDSSSTTMKFIRIKIETLPGTILDIKQVSFLVNNVVFQIVQGLLFSYSILLGSFAVLVVIERVSKSKHIQLLCGVKKINYWISTFLIDIIILLVGINLQCACIIVYGKAGLSTFDQYGRLICVFLTGGLAAIPLCYILSRYQRDQTSAFISLALFNILVGIGSYITVFITNLEDFKLQWLSRTLDNVFASVFPIYCFIAGIRGLILNYQFRRFCYSDIAQSYCGNRSDVFKTLIKNFHNPCCKDQCKYACLDWTPGYFDWEREGIGKYITILIIQAIIFIVALTLLEMEIGKNFKNQFLRGQNLSCTTCKPYDPSDNYMEEDQDVLMEKNRIVSMPFGDLVSTDTLIFLKLSKYYGSFKAVKELCVGIPKGECFGLLGVNGAGKTTTFKMLTGDEYISSGDAYLEGHSIKHDTKYINSKMGYCPQFDALLDTMTGRETLTMYGRIKGIPGHYINAQVKELSSMLYIEKHLDKLVVNYSGGNKRKISTAIALMGEPPIVLLDEPSSGMDPVARRCLWEALLYAQEKGCSLVFTSHSMEECESLCNRLVIMVNGQFCCLGSPQYLKNKFSHGFSLMVKLEQPVIYSTMEEEEREKIRRTFHDQMDDLKDYIEALYPNTVLKSSQFGTLQFHISEKNLNWANIFGNLEKAKHKFPIEDYSVGQTTLEQIFLNFAQLQR